MATQPTQNPVPSESPRDLKFNAGKIDEFVTSLALRYVDRFGTEHYTIEGLRQVIFNAIYDMGWQPVGTFQGGATLSGINDLIQDTLTQIWYRWDGVSSLPKIVPVGSTPASTGGIGAGKWLAVDVTDILRRQLVSNTGATMVGTQDGRNVQQWIVALDSAEYRAKNIAKLGWVDYQVHTRGSISVLFQGDSLTASYDQTSTDIKQPGTPPLDYDWATHASTTFPERFVSFLTEQSGCATQKVVRAISGYTAKQSYEYAQWQSNPGCDVAILMLGTNDSAGVSGATLDIYTEYMEKLIRRFIGWGCGVVVCSPSGGQYFGATSQYWARRLRNLASIYGCVFYDSQEALINRHKAAVASDITHYNTMGYAMHAHQLASLFMGGGLVASSKPVGSEIYMYAGMVSDYYGYCDAKGNVDLTRSDSSFVRSKATGILPAGQASLATFSFYLDAEAAHVTGKLLGPINVLLKDTDWFTGVVSYYSAANPQLPHFSLGVNIGKEGGVTGPIGGAVTQGGTQFIGRIIGRGWHTITIHNALDGSAVRNGVLNSLVITPVPAGFAATNLWNNDERKIRVVHSKKFPSPTGRGTTIPTAVPLTSIHIRCPQSLLPTGVGDQQGAWSAYYNSGSAKLRLTTAGGYVFEGALLRNSSAYTTFKVIQTFSNFPTTNNPTIVASLATAINGGTPDIAANSVGTKMPLENIWDYNSGLSKVSVTPNQGFTGGIYLVLDLTWPLGPNSLSDYWNIEVDGGDYYGNSEAAFGTR